MKQDKTHKPKWRFNGVHYALAIIFAAAGIFGMASAVETAPGYQTVQQSALR